MEFDILIILVVIHCPPPCCRPRPVLSPSRPRPAPKQADSYGHIILVSNWIQKMDTLTADQRLEEKIGAYEGEGSGVSFPTAKLLQTRLWQGLPPSVTPAHTGSGLGTLFLLLAPSVVGVVKFSALSCSCGFTIPY